jgi:hypothetical protein
MANSLFKYKKDKQKAIKLTRYKKKFKNLKGYFGYLPNI